MYGGGGIPAYCFQETTGRKSAGHQTHLENGVEHLHRNRRGRFFGEGVASSGSTRLAGPTRSTLPLIHLFRQRCDLSLSGSLKPVHKDAVYISKNKKLAKVLSFPLLLTAAASASARAQRCLSPTAYTTAQDFISRRLLVCHAPARESTEEQEGSPTTNYARRTAPRRELAACGSSDRLGNQLQLPIQRTFPTPSTLNSERLCVL